MPVSVLIAQFQVVKETFGKLIPFMVRHRTMNGINPVRSA